MVDSVLFLANSDQEGLISYEEAISAMEDAYEEYGRGVAKTIPRQRLNTPKDDEHLYHWFNVIPGVVPGNDTAAIRLNSTSLSITEKRGTSRFEYPGAFSGLVLLFDTQTNELLAVLQDFYLNPLRVAATSAVATKRLAPRRASTMGVFGSGTQATTHITYTCQVRDLDEIRVYSTNPDRRQSFADRMDDRVAPDVVPVSSARDAVSGCDIVVTATNANGPVFDGEWVEPGTHVNVVTPSNETFFPRREMDETTLAKSDILVVNSKDLMHRECHSEVLALQRGKINEKQLYDLGELMVQDVYGRTHDSQITYHGNNGGMGIQFAALGRLVYERAMEQELGTELDADLFMQYDGDLIAVRNRGFVHRDDV
jgi:ornithine cyclodeaminase/alanine dehydrogenase-like protein (mu-crystallin family)